MKPFVTVLLFLMFCLNCTAQVAQTQSAWYMYAGQYKLRPKWGLHLDVQFRSDLATGRMNQYLTRAGIQYYPQSSVNITTGYAHVQTYNPGLILFAEEHRIWEQLGLATASSSFTGTHRLRIEQRWIEKWSKGAAGEASRNGFNTGHRIRYMYRGSINLSKNTERISMPYFVFMDEVFFNFASAAINRNAFDQNRGLLGIGIFHKKHTRFEIGYMNQLLNPSTGKRVMNHILQAAVIQSLNFFE